MKTKHIRLLLSGGGTMGSVTPLLAVYETIRPHAVLWIGTKHGPERAVVLQERIPFIAIFSGKLRRYASMWNMIDPFFIVVGFLQACVQMIRFHPTHVLGAGAYVSVPVALAAWIFRVPVYTVQTDIRPGLANKLIAPFCRNVFCAFEASANAFARSSVVGSLVRQQGETRRACGFSIDQNKPLVVVVGGGTGAKRLNELVWEIVPRITQRATMIHSIGKGKRAYQLTALRKQKGYVPSEFIYRIDQLYAQAAVVVSRGGTGSLSELAALKKASIIVPMPKTHQEENARYLAEQEAIVSFDERASADALAKEILALLADDQRRKRLGERLHEAMPTDGAQRIAAKIRYATRETTS